MSQTEINETNAIC